MNECDVMIVGAGPAGAATALALGPTLRTVIVDKRKAPWRKPCDGVLTPTTQRVLAGFGIDPVLDLDARGVPALRVIDFDNHRESEIPLANHVIVDRMALDQALQCRAAARDNIEFLGSTRVLGARPDADGVSVEVQREPQPSILRTRILVDASGAYGFSRRIALRQLPCVLACQQWFRTESKDIRFDWIFDGSATPFYLWSIHNGSGLALGTIVPLGKAREGTLAIEDRLKPSLAIKGHPYRSEMALMAMPAGLKDFWLGRGRLLAVGEAAGFINSGTGEGISFALRSGALCGRAISAAQCDGSALRIYRELAAGLVLECHQKASHAPRLFDARCRGDLPSEALLAPVSRSRVAEWEALGAAKT